MLTTQIFDKGEIAKIRSAKVADGEHLIYFKEPPTYTAFSLSKINIITESIKRLYQVKCK